MRKNKAMTALLRACTLALPGAGGSRSSSSGGQYRCKAVASSENTLQNAARKTASNMRAENSITM